MTTRRRLFLAIVLSGASGCTLIPRYSRPPLPVSEDWSAPVSDAAAPTAREIAQVGWKSFFRSPALRNVVQRTLENNRDLRVAALRIEQARALYRIERSDLLPGVAAGGSASRQSFPEAVSGTLARSAITSLYDASVAITSFELDLFGRLRSENKAALEEYLASEHAWRSVTISLVAEAANAYLQWLSDKKLLALTEETLAAQERTFELIRRSFENGVASKLDLAQVRQSVEIARADKAFFTRRLAQDRNALVLLMGTAAPEVFSAQIVLDDVDVLEELPVGIPSEVLLLRPDVQAAEHLLRSENARIGAARAAFFPRLSLTGSYGFASSELSDLFRSTAEGAWTFVPQLSVPLFQGGQNVANLDLAHVRKQISIAQYEQRIQNAFREVADELAARRTLSTQLDAQRNLVQATEESYDLSFARYRSGVDSFLSVLDAQRSLFQAQQQEIDIERQRLTNLVNLYKALGGGTRVLAVERSGESQSRLPQNQVVQHAP